MCQGKLMKAAALRSLDMCKAGTQRKHLQGFCRMWVARLGSLTCVACSCGAGSIWASGVALRAPASFSISWTEITESDMGSLRKSDCITAWLPLPRSMTISPDAAPLQRLQLLDLLGLLLFDALILQRSIAEIDYDVNRQLGPPWPNEGSGE